MELFLQRRAAEVPRRRGSRPGASRPVCTQDFSRQCGAMVEGIAPSVNVGWTPVRSRRGESPTHNNYQARQGRYRLFWSIVSVSTKALWYIESHLSGELSLEAIAGVVGVSRFHLSRVFAVSTGSSLAGYVRARCL